MTRRCYQKASGTINGTICSTSGQVSVEAVLMLTVVVAIALAVSNYVSSNEWFANLVSGPWQSLASTIQNGVPDAKGAADSAAMHPNSYSRVVTPKPANWQIQ